MQSIEPPLRPSDSAILAAMAALGHPLPVEKPVIVALRREEEPGQWNDLIGVMGDGLSYFAQGTTDPGLQPMRGNTRIPVNPLGVARVPADYYEGFFVAGYHGGGGTNRKHPALRQAVDKPVPVERWIESEQTWKPFPPVVGPYNLHRAAWKGRAAQVGSYSHGCLVVLERLAHWELLLRAGYPVHGPQTAEHRALRWDLCLIDWGDWIRLQLPTAEIPVVSANRAPVSAAA